jgi:hypothetical protein
MSANAVCMFCGKVYGTVECERDSHGICPSPATCKADYITWARGIPGAKAPIKLR